MDSIGIWHIPNGTPIRTPTADIGAERDLESWIEQDPGLLERGLVIVGRQIRLEGGPLDLLAIDPQGRWVLIEIKRDRLRREVIAQAIDYASCIGSSQTLVEQCEAYLRSKGTTQSLAGLFEQRGRSAEDDREVVVYLVGTAIDPGLERMVDFLTTRADMALRLVAFSAFRDSAGTIILARSMHEGDGRDAPMPGARNTPAPTADSVLSLADRSGVGTVVRTAYNAAVEVGLNVRPWPRSLMFGPPSAKSRCLFTVWSDRRAQEPGVAKAYIATEAFEQFYGIDEAELSAALQIGPVNGWTTLDQPKADRLAAGLKQLVPTA
jgi:Holliday junction resolvase-like predicted endonuclease